MRNDEPPACTKIIGLRDGRVWTEDVRGHHANNGILIADAECLLLALSGLRAVAPDVR